MLKRNGQLCQHSVPDYAGHLTDGEFEAYKSVFASVEGDFKELSAITEGLNKLEKSLPEFLERISSRNSQSATGQNGSKWEVIAPWPETPHAEMLWCKRQLGEMEEFAIVERFPEESPLAKAQGEFDVQMTDIDPLVCCTISSMLAEMRRNSSRRTSSRAPRSKPLKNIRAKI